MKKISLVILVYLVGCIMVTNTANAKEQFLFEKTFTLKIGQFHNFYFNSQMDKI